MKFRIILVLILSLFTITLLAAQETLRNGQQSTNEYDISEKVKEASTKNGLTTVQTFDDGSYLVFENRKGVQQFAIIKSGKTYPQKRATSKNAPISIQVGFCTVTISKGTVNLGSGKVTATARCN